ncbi:MAG TPA: BrnT family toxin [Bryobacteraceae bacterium]|nr:BrnT family toxin [Bryobacteraceae bacterium]
MFDWDVSNLRKIRAHRISRREVEEALGNDALLIYSQTVAAEERYVYYGETNRGRLLAVVLTERADLIRVVTAYDLDAGQKRDYLQQRTLGE